MIMLKAIKAVVDFVGVAALAACFVFVMAFAGALDAAGDDLSMAGFTLTVSVVCLIISLVAAVISHCISNNM